MAQIMLLLIYDAKHAAHYHFTRSHHALPYDGLWHRHESFPKQQRRHYGLSN